MRRAGARTCAKLSRFISSFCTRRCCRRRRRRLRRHRVVLLLLPLLVCVCVCLLSLCEYSCLALAHTHTSFHLDEHIFWFRYDNAERSRSQFTILHVYSYTREHTQPHVLRPGPAHQLTLLRQKHILARLATSSSSASTLCLSDAHRTRSTNICPCVSVNSSAKYL